MNYFLFFLIAVILTGITVCPRNDFHHGTYISQSNTRCIEGIFVLMVVFSHYSSGYITPGQNDNIYLAVQGHLGQNIVTMFLFYSGFGMMSGIQRKGMDYTRSIPKKFLKLLVRFDFAVFLFAVVQSFYGNTYSIRRLFLSAIGWSSIGYSNWYIFVMLCIYCCFYFSFLISYRFIKKNSDTVGALLLSVLCLLLVVIQKKIGREAYSYNTIVAFVAGVWFCKMEKRWIRYCMKTDAEYYAVVSIVVAMYALASLHKGGRLLWYEIWVLLFAALIVLISMKVSISSPLLDFLGSHVFSIYILQRIPMIVLGQAGFTKIHPYCSLIIVISSTFVLAVLFDWFFEKVLFKREFVHV